MSKIIVGGASAVIYKSGTALVAQIPDNAIAGGNARGANAVDFQSVRTAATQVANGARATISGGRNNTASGSEASVGGGLTNSATVFCAAVGGGSANIANGHFSWIPGGQFGVTRGIIGRGAWASARITANGDVQCGEQPLLRQSTDATATRLTADNAVGGTANQIVLPNFATYAGTLTVVAKATGSTDSATWRLPVSAVRGNGVATVVVYEGSGTSIVPTASSGTGSTWRLDVEADLTNGAIAVTGTGAAATTINWSARYSDVEAVTAS